MVTSLLGVRFIDESSPGFVDFCDEMWACGGGGGGGGVVGTLAGPESVGVAPSLSADMLL